MTLTTLQIIYKHSRKIKAPMNILEATY